jgi:hypothetical protein
LWTNGQLSGQITITKQVEAEVDGNVAVSRYLTQADGITIIVIGGNHEDN